MIDSKLLKGFSVDRAICYGMPHIGCHYESSSVNSHKLNENALCAVCGAPAVHAHHEPPKGMGAGSAYFKIGEHKLRPSLIALCENCHYDRHSKGLKIRFKLNDDETTNRWLQGELLDKGITPHSPEIYEYGYWVIYDDGSISKEISD